jgi:hypothetical protein
LDPAEVLHKVKDLFAEFWAIRKKGRNLDRGIDP